MGTVDGDDEVRRLRLRSQLLDPETALSDVPDVVSRVCGLQAQDARVATLGVRPRSHGLTASDVDAARFVDRQVVRTWCMRGTLHFVATEDVPWLLSVFGPVFVARSRTRLRNLGFDDDACDGAVGTIHDALHDGGPLTRVEIAETLRRAGFEFDPGGQAPYHLIRRAALQGLVCEVAHEDGAEAYGLLDEWVELDAFPDRDDGLRTLARRYLSAYQPASLEDFASWSGLPMADVRTAWAALEDETTAVGDGEDRVTMQTGDPLDDVDAERPSIRLLPAYDTYLLGYSDRTFAVSAANAGAVWPGGGVIRPVVVRDGRVIATWTFDRSGGRPRVVVTPFDGAPSDLDAALRTEVEDCGRFLDEDVGYRIDSTD